MSTKGEQMTLTGPVDPGQIRVEDAQREQMAQRLQRAHANGQLDLDEYDRRVQRAYSARVQQDLDALVLDLPAEVVDSVPGHVADAWAGADRRLQEARERVARAQRKSADHVQNVLGARRHPQHRGGSQGGVVRTLMIVLGVLVGLAVVSMVVGVVLKLVVPVLVIAGIIAIVRAIRGS